jgi:hypothetical protein
MRTQSYYQRDFPALDDPSPLDRPEDSRNPEDGRSYWVPANAAIAVPGMTAYSAAAKARFASPFNPAASRSTATLSVASHVNSGSSRPKWP